VTIFMGLETGKRAIMVQQLALQTTGHNIANANTPGYTRQLVTMEAARPYAAPGIPGSAGVGQIGTGVKAGEIGRIREEYTDMQIRKENRYSGYWDTISNSMEKVEVVINEPSDYGLRSVMEAFWQSWQDVVGNPENKAVRSVVVERGTAVSETFNHMFQQFTDLNQDVNANISIQVDEINSKVLQIRDLNQGILAVNVAGQQPNDLKDKRDLLLDELSKIANFSITEDSYGMVNMEMSGRTIVQGVSCTNLTVEDDANGMSMVTWKDTGIKANISGGELGALLDLRGQTNLAQENAVSEYKEIIPELIEELNIMAKTIVVMTNEIHRGGYSLNNNSNPDSAYPDGANFFTMPDDPDMISNWSSYIQVDDLILNDVNNIAAAGSRTWDENNNQANFGDGSVALQIAQLRQYINSPAIKTTSDALNGVLTDFPASIAGDLTITYDGGTTTTISLAVPAEEYQDLRELAAAIQKELENNSDLNDADISINVICDGDRLAFLSSSTRFEGAVDSGLFGGTVSFSGIENMDGIIENSSNDDYWNSIATRAGLQSQEAVRMAENQNTLLTQLENQRQSVSGVSLDEEMTDMIKYQHAYNAASRFITTIDEALDQIINRMGMVGR